MNLFVGTSGYSYKEWRGSFYPEKMQPSEMLAYYADRFRAVEINSTFYRMPNEKMLVDWAAQVPDGFSFVLKTSRKVTHQMRLRSVDEEISYLLRTMSVLGAKRGPMLVQLPPNAKKDLNRLGSFLGLLPDEWRTAMEFRNASWFEPDTYELLRERNVALVATDTEGGGAPLVGTADWGYVRLRGEAYDDSALGGWAARLRESAWKDLYLFFKHEEDGVGPELASRFTTVWEATR